MGWRFHAEDRLRKFPRRVYGHAVGCSRAPSPARCTRSGCAEKMTDCKTDFKILLHPLSVIASDIRGLLEETRFQDSYQRASKVAL